MKYYKTIIIILFSLCIYLINTADIYQKYSNLASLNLMYSGASFALFKYDQTTHQFQRKAAPRSHIACDGPYTCLNNICELSKINTTAVVGIYPDDNLNKTHCSSNYKEFLNSFHNYSIFGYLILCSIGGLVILLLYSLAVTNLNKNPYILLTITYIVMVLIYSPIWTSYGIWYFDFYRKEVDTPPGTIELATNILTISMVIISLLNVLLYPLAIISLKKSIFPSEL